MQMINKIFCNNIAQSNFLIRFCIYKTPTEIHISSGFTRETNKAVFTQKKSTIFAWTQGINCYVFIQMWLSKISDLMFFSDFFFVCVNATSHYLLLLHDNTTSFKFQIVSLYCLNRYIPALFRDNHLRRVLMKAHPQIAVTQIHTRSSHRWLSTSGRVRASADRGHRGR